MAQPYDSRPDPDALIASAEGERRGKLKIFLGAAPGVGKTWEMLTAANHKRQAGLDVVAGLIETHGRAETITAISDLEILPRQKIPYGGQSLEEFDLDAALARHPAVLLIDELAHTNAPGLRHGKRWQDVREILDAGIDVWTTLNVQHLESLNDAVSRITGIQVKETIPDTVLDLASEIELIDLPPAELRARLSEGKIYRQDVANRALNGFFREGNLGALREMALRRAAQRVDKDVASYMRARAIPGPWPASERVLALIGHEQSADVVRHAARLADALRAPLVAFHVERLNDGAGIQAALDLAVQLGGTVETTTSSFVLNSILEYASRHNVTHIVIGRGARRRWWWRAARRSLGEVLTRQATEFTLHFVPVSPRTSQRLHKTVLKLEWLPYLMVVLVLGAVTAIGYVLRALIPQEAMGLIFTAVIAGAASRYGRAVGLASAIAGFALWNFFFLAPAFTFTVADPRDIVTLTVFLIVGVITGSLAGRVRMEAQTASSRIEALRRISLFGQRFSRAATTAELLHDTAAEAAAITTAGLVLAATDNTLQITAATPKATTLDESGFAAAEWAYRNNIETGIGTSTLPSVPWRFLPLRVDGHAIGVLGAKPGAVPSEPLSQTLAALADQSAMALERVRLTMDAAQNTARQDSQKLRTALLSSLSHDLRTPLTAIRGAAETLESTGDALDKAVKADLLASISQNTERMTKFLANIMEMARVETGEIIAKRVRLSLAEIIESAVGRVSGTMTTSVNIAPNAGEVMGDAALLEQIIVNLLDNAVKYAGVGSRITITARCAKTTGPKNIAITVADEGVGIASSDLPHIFSSFFRATRGDRVAPGTGLGLAIAKAFAEAMGGSIHAQSPRLDLPADGAPGTIMIVEIPAA